MSDISLHESSSSISSKAKNSKRVAKSSKGSKNKKVNIKEKDSLHTESDESNSSHDIGIKYSIINEDSVSRSSGKSGLFHKKPKVAKKMVAYLVTQSMQSHKQDPK